MTSFGIDLGVNEIRLAISKSLGQAQYFKPFIIQPARDNNIQPYRPLLRNLLDDASGMYLSSQSIRPVDLATNLLLEARNQVAKELTTPESNCALTIPCGYGARGRQQFQDAARLAGFENSRFILEPAAILFAEKMNDVRDSAGQLALVCSWGESGCNILLARRQNGKIEEVASRGELALSGRKLAENVIKQFYKIYKKSTGQDPDLSPESVSQQHREAKRALHVLSSDAEVKIRIARLSGNEPETYLLTRSELLSWISGDLDKCLKICEQVLEKGNVESPKLIDELWLAGGITEIPYVKSLFKNWWGQEPKIASKESAARGAAIYASLIWDDQKKADTAQVVSPEQPYPNVEIATNLINDSSNNLKPLERTDTPEILIPDETRLFHLLRQTDEMLKIDDIDNAKQSIQEALNLFNIYRAKVFYAEGMKTLESVRGLLEQNPYIQKGIAKEVDEKLIQAYNKVQEAVKLDHQQERYQTAILGIEQMQKERRIEVKYAEAMKAIEKRDLANAQSLFEEIFKLDPKNELCRPYYAGVLEELYYRRKQELINKIQRTRAKPKEFEIELLRKTLLRLKEIYGLKLVLVDELQRIEREFRSNKK